MPRHRLPAVSSLDLTLAVRMLIKYPALSAVAVTGMAVAIAIGAATFTFFYAYMAPALPLDEGDRIVAIENWDIRTQRREQRTLHDFATWREQLKTITDVAAYREIARNIITADGRSERERLAEMTASAFRLVRVSPLLGRPLADEDERRDAAPVMVIGYDVWRERFAARPDVIGTTVRAGDVVFTIVGVMPKRFAFPVNHRVWVPLQAQPSDYARREGPAINVFGRLGDGVSAEQAQAELATIGANAARAFPATNEPLRPRLAPYTSLWFGDDLVLWHVHVMQFLITLILVVVSVNVASLVYARTASRQGEIVVRSALGGSRRRIVTQLFVEALMLAGVAAAVGLALADRALVIVYGFMNQLDGVPFWVDEGLSSGAVLYVIGLTVIGAAIVGAVPALKATGRALEPGLRQLSGGTSLRLGRTWTALIVAQVALAVAVMPSAFSVGWQAIGYRTFDAGFAADAFLTLQLSMDRDVPPTVQAQSYRDELATRFAQRVTDVITQLRAEPTVVAATFASRLPGGEASSRIEIEQPQPKASATPLTVRTGWVALDFFETFEVPVLAGRIFTAGDLSATAQAVAVPRVPTVSGRIGQATGSSSSAPVATARSAAIVVNRSLAQQIAPDGNVLGRRVRYASASREAASWYEIVGVVADFPPQQSDLTSTDARLYHPVTAADAHPVNIAVRVSGAAPTSLATRVRELTTALDPTLQVSAVSSLDQVYQQEQRFVRLGALTFGIVTSSVVLLSAAGIYALMAFTVTQRRREIGIRTALGADPRRILRGIFAKAVRQLIVGLVIGLLIAVALFEEMTDGHTVAEQGVILMPAVAVIMVTVGLLAAIGPVRRGLQVNPTEALRD